MDSSADVETRLLPHGSADIGGSREDNGGEASYGSLATVRIARIGELPHGGKVSRDDSVHVTDEVRLCVPWVSLARDPKVC